MCGICGLAGFGLPATGQATIRQMTASLAHRGPDAQDVWLHPQDRCALGHARLSIIDLECGGQPMHSADGRYVIVFNGEIYNFQSLRKELEQQGRVFRTRSDTEVLLQAYAEWGLNALQHFGGMFAFAIYDTVEDSLFLARDRVGIKPLYYHWENGKLAFASEIKALFKLPALPRRLDYRALADYITLGYPMAPTTFFADVRELRPGHWLQLRGGKVREGCYWSWRRDEQDWSEKEALAKTKETLLTALEEHMIADVPVGAMLSGGIDSSLLVSLLAKELGVRVEAFTVSFGDREYDESSYASVIAKHLGLMHRKVSVSSDSIADLDEIHVVLDQFDQPFVDSSAIPMHLLCGKLRKYVKVAIGGDGGDETFGGYPRFYYADVAHRLGRCPAPVLAAAESLRSPVSCFAPGAARQFGKLVRAARQRGQRRIFDLLAYNDPLRLPEILTPDAFGRLNGYSPRVLPEDCSGRSLDGRDMIDATMNVTLPGDYLRKIDVMSMAHGLEVRVPFLGKRVLELAAKIPHHLKHPGRNYGKMLLRTMLREYLPPEEQITRRGKAGFTIPLDSSLGVEKRQAIETMLTRRDARIRSLIDADYTQTVARAFVTGQWCKANWSRFAVYQNVYMLWSLERWLQKWDPLT
jgi:asparagine synthase (glutamine-hydrolysing)